MGNFTNPPPPITVEAVSSRDRQRLQSAFKKGVKQGLKTERAKVAAKDAEIAAKANGIMQLQAQVIDARAAIQAMAEKAEAEANRLVDRWNSDLGASSGTMAAGVAAYIIAGFQGDIVAAQIKLERKYSLKPGEVD